jgi:hypothetical protein
VILVFVVMSDRGALCERTVLLPLRLNPEEIRMDRNRNQKSVQVDYDVRIQFSAGKLKIQGG